MALGLVCALFGLVVAVLGGAGILGTRSATHTGSVIAGDELLTTTTTAEVGLSMGAAYAAGETSLLTPDPARQTELRQSLFATLLAHRRS